MSFELHEQLARDTYVLGDLPLCRVLLMNDAQYPWCILVPRQAGIRELYELEEADQQGLFQELAATSKGLMGLYQGLKCNVAALGNMVPQLHWHIVVRYAHDAAWPGPIWGVSPPQSYTRDAAQERFFQITGMLGQRFPDFSAASFRYK